MSPHLDLSLTPAEVRAYLTVQRKGVLATHGPRGFPHQVAMWYALEDDRILLWVYARSQKAKNIRRDPRVSFLVDDGDAYPTLRGVLLQGVAETHDDPEEVLRVGVLLRLRYNSGSDAEEARARLLPQVPKRLVVTLAPTHVVSWDHRKIRT